MAGLRSGLGALRESSCDDLLQAPEIGVPDVKALQLVDGLQEVVGTRSPVSRRLAQDVRELLERQAARRWRLPETG